MMAIRGFGCHSGEVLHFRWNIHSEGKHCNQLSYSNLGRYRLCTNSWGVLSGKVVVSCLSVQWRKETPAELSLMRIMSWLPTKDRLTVHPFLSSEWGNGLIACPISCGNCSGVLSISAYVRNYRRKLAQHWLICVT